MKNYQQLLEENEELKFRLSEYEWKEAVRQSVEIENKHNKLGYKLRRALIDWGLIEK